VPRRTPDARWKDRAVTTAGAALFVIAFWSLNYASALKQNSQQYAGCLRGTATRIIDTRNAASDSDREYALAAFGRPAESQAHETSALRKHEAALAYLTQAGVQDSYALGKLSQISPDQPLVLRQRARFCRTQYARPSIF
jgi:hypothetical protein